MNVKAGDLAYIVRSDVDENRGAIVEVVEIDELETALFCTTMWRVRSRKPLLGFYGMCYEGTCEDHRLRPIVPPGLSVEIDAVEPVEFTA